MLCYGLQLSSCTVLLSKAVFPTCPNARELSKFLPAAALSPFLGQDGLPGCDLPGGGELRAGIGLMEKLRSRCQAE